MTTSTFCIVDIAEEVTLSVIELLADYYDCYFERLNHKDNDISWWLYTDTEKIITIKEGNDEKDKLVEKLQAMNNASRNFDEGSNVKRQIVCYSLADSLLFCG